MSKLKTITIFLIISVLFYLLATHILLTSYYSYQEACNPEGFKETKEKLGLVVVGKTTFEETETGETNVTVEYEEFSEKQKKETIKHECIHVYQYNTRPWVLSCDYPVRKYFSEVEAYLGQYYADGLYKFIYGDECLEYYGGC